MRHPSIKALYEYWNRLRGDRIAPARTEVSPRDIAAALGDVFLLDGPEEEFRFRLAGSRIVDTLGRKLTGVRFADIWLDRVRPATGLTLNVTTADAAPILMGIRACNAVPDTAEAAPRSSVRPLWANFRQPESTLLSERRTHSGSSGEMILLPLHHNNQSGGRILGAMALFTRPALPVTEPQRLDMTGTRVLGDAVKPATGLRLLPAAQAETVIGRYGHLVVLRGLKPDSAAKSLDGPERG